MDRSRGPEAPGASSGQAFDPRPHLRRIRAHGQEVEYLDVRWRLIWLRGEHPDARITTEQVSLNDNLAVFRALVEIPGGGVATGYGSETAGNAPDFIERAETRAIGRALAALGYGTPFAPDFDLEEPMEPVNRPVAEAPVERRPAPRLHSVAPPEPEPPAPRPVRPQPQPVAAREAEPASPEVNPAAVSWTDFWTEVRRLGYQSRSELATLLGHPIDSSMTPAEVWAELVAYRRAHGEPDEDG
ncbi:MAG TPA: hypothetical protein VFN57_08405 [Thermomicrobiaceae bacterium]|nr:hypothetical protein [Thermomicrobiaceae bacterium]